MWMPLLKPLLTLLSKGMLEKLLLRVLKRSMQQTLLQHKRLPKLLLMLLYRDMYFKLAKLHQVPLIVLGQLPLRKLWQKLWTVRMLVDPLLRLLQLLRARVCCLTNKSLLRLLLLPGVWPLVYKLMTI